ncbi:S-adenosyl-L-methionine-dependent methyltransferase [Trametes coccinea BRFM310]|uniref:S-adenosyl-L-methionine-dependent methyltransferase n=1 Tax=Trametes coccinea (strain BRFM310) TaxID=1353009 RepID=A0A1Y2IYQ3_TRAC3|nr:S-adenosyl-L-methionine-dependent methyltransferase [Trametes coccinea BRFM310]
MTSTHPRSRSGSPSQPPEKKPRLEAADSAVRIQDAPADHQAPPSTGTPTAPAKQPKKHKNKKTARRAPEPYSHDDILLREVIALLGQHYADAAKDQKLDWDAPFEQSQELELTVSCISPSTGNSLSIASANDRRWVIVTPLSLPGERIRVRVYRHSQLHSHADLLEVIEPNPEWRDMSLVQCKYFGKCAGCQYQMLSYEKQLDLKRQTVVEAYKNYSNIPSDLIPPIGDTIGSPLQYGYRTKLTPHFQRPPFSFQKAQKRGDAPAVEGKPEWLKIGFHVVGTRQVMDIEECPIATPVINKGLVPVRQNVIDNITKYKNGATLLLRDSLRPGSSGDTDFPATTSIAAEDGEHVCVTDQKATVRERVGDMLFEYTAGTFFQNNNSALVPLTTYARDAIFPPDASFSAEKPTHLVDAYCGSGLFSIMLAPHFTRVAGIELSAESIRAAERNAALNALPASQISFMAGDAANIFDTVQDFPRARTALVIDPPRKGTDERFIDQMLAFGAGTVVYVSCNVHTQARDVGMILRKSEERAKEGVGKKYVLESLRGLDLFPQTAHVEAIAVLRLV